MMLRSPAAWRCAGMQFSSILQINCRRSGGADVVIRKNKKNQIIEFVGETFFYFLFFSSGFSFSTSSTTSSPAPVLRWLWRTRSGIIKVFFFNFFTTAAAFFYYFSLK